MIYVEDILTDAAGAKYQVTFVREEIDPYRIHCVLNPIVTKAEPEVPKVNPIDTLQDAEQIAQQGGQQ